MEMKQYQEFFHKTYSNLTSLIIDREILKYAKCYFNHLYNWHVSISLPNWAKWNEVKSNSSCANLTACFPIYEVLRCYNDFWNVFLDEVFLKNESNSLSLIP